MGDFEAGGDSEEDEDNYGYGDKGEGGGADDDNEEDHDLEIETDEDNHEEDRDLEAYEDDDDGDDDNNRDEDSEHEIDNENHEVDSRLMFAFPEGAMNRPLEVYGHKTAKEALVLDLALFIRHKWTFESLIDNFGVKNLLFDTKYFPSSKRELFKLLGRNESGIVAYVYCACGNLIGKKSELGPVVKCGCNRDVIVAKAKVFYVLSLKQQLKQFLETPGIPEHLQYREKRKKVNEEAIEDVFDGQRYKELQRKMTALDFTFTLNTDGCRIGKKAKGSVYPVFARINELPPNLRQKYIFLVGLYGDKCEPNMEAFLSPVVDEINKVADEGVEWYLNGDQENNEAQVSHFYPYCFCVDGKASAQILNMVPHGSNYACSTCTFKGVNINKVQRYPALPHPLIPPYEERTHAQMERDMLQAYHTKEIVYGHKGLSALMTLKNFDLVKGKGFDDLHFFYECAAKHNFELLLKEAPRVKDPVTKQPLSYAVIERTIDARLKKLRTPSKIARKPINMKLKNREQFTGTEWRNILLYYGEPCLNGLIKPSHIKHFQLLSTAAHIYSRDVIFEEDILRAEKLIDKYLILYEQYYGIEKTRLNLHTLKHAGNSVRLLGPLFVYSTFNFESWNYKLLLYILSSKGYLLQIIVKHFIRMFLEYLTVSISEDLSEETKEKCAEILQIRKLRLKRTKVEEHVYVMDKVQNRVLTENERQMLEREGFSVQTASFYDKISVNNCLYQTKDSIKAEVLSDDSMFYSKQDTFCTVDAILVFQDANGKKTAGLLVFEHDVMPGQGSHICMLSPQLFDLKHFITSDLVKCPIVQMPVNDAFYVAPLPNTFEID